jgi:hypothetical protein
VVVDTAAPYAVGMIRNLVFPSAIALTLVFGACTSEKPSNQGSPNQQAPKPEASAVRDRVVAEAATFDAKCGCSIEGVGHCGNFVRIDGHYIPIVHASLGRMEWCGKKDSGAKIEASGEIKDGKFVAKQIKTLE